MRPCPVCEVENPEHARFCLSCGAELDPTPVAGDVRKTVTVLFSDVADSTTLAEQMDPETFRHVLARWFTAARGAIERHGGTVEKFIGDAVMAVFGVPVLHEDDALRAVRAAVALREELAAVNEELRRDRGVTLQIRTGVNTGEVVVAGDRERLAAGDAVNVAARLQSAGAPGDILIGAETERLVRHGAQLEFTGPLALKGKQALVPVWRVLGVHEDSERADRGRREAALVGRDRELGLLSAAVGRALAGGAGGLLTVLGGPGVGKSRLVRELAESLGGGVRVLRGRCLPYGEDVTLRPVVEMVHDAAGVHPGQTSAPIMSALSKLSLDHEVVKGLEALLGVRDDGEGTWAAGRMFAALARVEPLLLVFDDLQWADAALLDLVDELSDLARDLPLIVAAVARPELLEMRPLWGGGRANAVSLTLEPLEQHDTEELVRQLLGALEIEDDELRSIAETAEGNPLFAEEMLAMLEESGALERSAGGWRSTGALAAVAVPPSVHAVVATRVDRLDPAPRSVLSRASVIGREFSVAALRAVTPEAERPALAGQLEVLVRKELLRPVAGTDGGEFRFRHILARDAAYAQLSKEARADLHEAYADHLEAHAGEATRQFGELVGFHLERARNLRTELAPVEGATQGLGQRAASHLAIAGHRALRRGEAANAAGLLGRAASLLRPEDSARAPVLLDYGQALVEAGRLEQAETALAEAVHDAQANGDGIIEWRARVERAALALARAADVTGVADEAAAALPALRELGDEAGCARAWWLRGELAARNGREAERAAALRQAIMHAEQSGDDRLEGALRGWLLASLLAGPAPLNEVVGTAEETLTWARSCGDRGLEASALVSLGRLRAELGDPVAGRHLYEEGRAIHSGQGRRLRAAQAALAGAYIELAAKNPSAAEGALRDGLEELARMGGATALHEIELADVLVGEGRYDEAETLLERAGADADADTDMALRAGARAVRAKLLAGRGLVEEALALSDEAIALAESTDAVEWQGEALLDRAQVLLVAGRGREALDAAEAAERRFVAKGVAVSVDRAHQLAERARMSEVTAVRSLGG